jgi:hypothetical protein
MKVPLPDNNLRNIKGSMSRMGGISAEVRLTTKPIKRTGRGRKSPNRGQRNYRVLELDRSAPTIKFAFISDSSAMTVAPLPLRVMLRILDF